MFGRPNSLLTKIDIAQGPCVTANAAKLSLFLLMPFVTALCNSCHLPPFFLSFFFFSPGSSKPSLSNFDRNWDSSDVNIPVIVHTKKCMLRDTLMLVHQADFYGCTASPETCISELRGGPAETAPAYSGSSGKRQWGNIVGEPPDQTVMLTKQVQDALRKRVKDKIVTGREGCRLFCSFLHRKGSIFCSLTCFSLERSHSSRRK